MHSLFKPAIRFLNRLSYPRKLALVGLLFALPFSVVTLFWLRDLNERIAFTAEEQLAVTFLRPIHQLTSDLRDHRGMTWSNPGAEDARMILRQIEDRIEDDIQEVDRIKQSEVATRDTIEVWTEIQKELQRLGDESMTVVPFGRGDFHTQLISDVSRMRNQLGESSHLQHDADGGIYQVADVLINHLPKLIEHIGRLRGYSTAVAKGKSITDEFRGQVQFAVNDIEDERETVRRYFERGFSKGMDDNSIRDLHAALSAGDVAADRFIKLVRTLAESDANSRVSSDDVWKIGSETHDEYNRLYSLTSVTLGELLNQRITDLKRQRVLIGIAILAGVLIAAYMSMAFYFGVMHTIAQLEEVTSELLNRESDYEDVQIDTRDELGQIANSCNAIAGDRERCLAVGMDGYLSKPMNVDSVTEALSRIVVKIEIASESHMSVVDGDTAHAASAAGFAAAEHSGRPNTAISTIVRKQVFDLPSALNRVDGDVEFFRELVSEYLDRSSGMMEEIKHAAHKGETIGLEKAAHYFKGTVMIFSTKPVEEAARVLEGVARDGKLHLIPNALRELEELSSQLQTELQNFLDIGE